jgi:hypothetical protein
MDYLYQRIVNSDKMLGVDRIYFPSEIEQLKQEERLQPIDQFGILTNRTTLHAPIGQYPHNWSIRVKLTNIAKINVRFAQWCNLGIWGQYS